MPALLLCVVWREWLELLLPTLLLALVYLVTDVLLVMHGGMYVYLRARSEILFLSGVFSIIPLVI